MFAGLRRKKHIANGMMLSVHFLHGDLFYSKISL